MDLYKKIESYISFHTKDNFSLKKIDEISGGSINRTIKIKGQSQSWFVKINSIEKKEIFHSEIEGLYALSKTESFDIPKILCLEEFENYSFLIMEYIQPTRCNKEKIALAGENLAKMHALKNIKFGWESDNFIGTTIQINSWTDSWKEFFKENRLKFQLDLAIKNGYFKNMYERNELFLEKCSSLLNHYPEASLLHGDLWNGNFFCGKEGELLIFDPAVYFGDHEADLAMTELFGGFGQDFYDAYQSILPLSEEYKIRKKLYNLYHILNHLNLFGGVYENQANEMINYLVSEC
tara:strand:- start:9714 stop:10592 length:879 start_codon:yes stop_codon:yes gene_type:complete